jgi:hypothetical protein
MVAQQRNALADDLAFAQAVLVELVERSVHGVSSV